jgi:hypothetical protein
MKIINIIILIIIIIIITSIFYSEFFKKKNKNLYLKYDNKNLKEFFIDVSEFAFGPILFVDIDQNVLGQYPVNFNIKEDAGKVNITKIIVPRGVPGNDGTRGPQGSIGPQGTQGPAGEAETGAPGAPCECTNGEPGSDASECTECINGLPGTPAPACIPGSCEPVEVTCNPGTQGPAGSSCTPYKCEAGNPAKDCVCNCADCENITCEGNVELEEINSSGDLKINTDTVFSGNIIINHGKELCFTSGNNTRCLNYDYVNQLKEIVDNFNK